MNDYDFQCGETEKQRLRAERWKQAYLKLRFKFGVFLFMVPLSVLVYLIVQINSYFRG